MKDNKELDFFGKMLMEDVRDNAINQWEGYSEGLIKSEQAQDFFRKIQPLDLDLQTFIKSLFPKIIRPLP